MEAFSALKYGTVGLCAVLMYFAFQLLAKEQKAEHPRQDILGLIKLFMVFAIISMIIGLSSQLPIFRNSLSPETATTQWASGYGPDYFTGKWELQQDSHDVLAPQFSFKPRYSYTGTLTGHVDGNDLVMTGDMTSNDINNHSHELGTAKFTFRGPINNNEAAGHFTYTRRDVSGFGTAFLKFDSAGDGVMYMIVRVTKPNEGEGDVAMVIIRLRRISS
jgi:hypothetical protein